jgi:hypothetical protein
MPICFCATGCARNPLADPGAFGSSCSCFCHQAAAEPDCTGSTSVLIGRVAVIGPSGDTLLYAEPNPTLRDCYPSSHGFELRYVYGYEDSDGFHAAQPDELYHGTVNPFSARTLGEDYDVARYGTEVVLRVGGEPPYLGSHPSIEVAQAAFADATTDPDGPAAPSPGDTLELFDGPPDLRVAAVRRLPGAVSAWHLTDTAGAEYTVEFGRFRLRTRPLSTRTAEGSCES